MGSLPNLNEIGRDDEAYYIRTGLPPFGPVPVPASYHRGNGDGGGPGRPKIRYRQSERGDLPRPRRKMLPPKWVPFNDLTLQQTATSSPASTRSAVVAHSIRRRDSLTSSIGATSERRLINAVRNYHGRPGGPHCSRRVFIRYLVVFCVSHLLFNSTYLPFLVLQASVSVWTLPFRDAFPFSINVGSFLIALMYSFAALASLFSPYVVRRLGVNVVLMYTYTAFALFHTLHLYPALYLLAPVYVCLGLAMGSFSLCHVAFLMGLSSKMSCAISEYDDDVRLARRTVIVRRFARAIRASQDVGLIFGSLIASVVIALWHHQPVTETTSGRTAGLDSNCTIGGDGCDFSGTNGTVDYYQTEITAVNSLVDSIFDTDEHGHRVCGAYACASDFVFVRNASDPKYFALVPRGVTVLLSGVFVGLSIVCLVIAGLGMRKVRTFMCQDGGGGGGGGLVGTEFVYFARAVQKTFRDVRLRLAAPMAIFIGMEQAFIYSDFGKSYVVCTLGVQHLNLVFLSMGVLQSIAACTLSMLLKSIQRYYIVGVGFIFQCCVLMVQMLWKPMSDDPALFYVIPAVWGVCNAIWEILTFSLLTALYSDNWSAPFCNSTFFRYVGLAISFAFHGLLCNWIKLYILAVSMVFAVAPFLWLEIRLAKGRKGHHSSNRL